MVAYLGWLSAEGKVAGGSIAGYVSAINSFYTKMGLDAPALVGPKTLHPSVRTAQEGYKRQVQSASPVRPHGATSCEFIELCGMAANRAMARRDARVARACVCQVVQFYFLERPTSNLALRRSDVVFISPREVQVTRRSLAIGRKDKAAATRLLTRRGPVAMAASHPLAIFRSYLDFARPVHLGGVGHPEYVFGLSDDSRREPPFGTPASLLEIAGAAVGPLPDDSRTPHAHRRGSATAAYHLGVDGPTLHHHADWAPGSTVFEQSYFVPSLPRSPLAPQWFGDLLNPPLF